MLSKYKQKRDQGFTIIEVLIVLAIAGLIMLVVFLAIPALQRNSRNTQRTNDVANLLGGVGEYVSNNNGQLPDPQAAGAANSTSYTLGAGVTGANDIEVPLGYYSGSDVTVIDVGTGQTGNDDEDQVRIVLGASCDGSNAAEGASRGYVALYTLENDAQQCRES